VSPVFGNPAASANAATAELPYSASRRGSATLRRASLVVFVMSMVLSACGRQITGLGSANSGATVPVGDMSLRFRANSAMDFNNFRYVIVFNTSGTGGEPYANALTTGFANYSFAWIVGGSGGVTQPELIQYYAVPGTGSGLQSRQIVVPPNFVQMTYPSSGTNNEFTLTFSRSLFNIPNPAGTSPAPATASPSPSPSAGPSPAASASPSASPASGTPAPSAFPTSDSQSVWYINFFTTDPNGNPIDANGTTGINDTSFVLSLNVNNVITASSGVSNDPYVKPAGSSTGGSNLAAQINQNEVDNAP
jgi:hypothetical protein